MEERIEVLGLRMDCMRAKEAMLCAMQFMENDSVDTIEIVDMETLMNCQDDGQWRAAVEEFGLVVPGETELLEAADIHDAAILRETDGRVFLKMFFKYLQKNHKRVYLLAETEEELEQAKSASRRYSHGMRITGHSLLAADGGREEEVINEINGTETDCIVSVLPSPYQELFISRNRTLLNAKAWFGCGASLAKSYDEGKTLARLRHFFKRTMFRRQVEKQHKEK